MEEREDMEGIRIEEGAGESYVPEAGEADAHHDGAEVKMNSSLERNKIKKERKVKDIKDSEDAPENEKEIDLLALAKQIWSRRKMVLIWCAVAAVIALVVGYSIPKEYSTSVMLAPEASDSKNSGSLSTLAAMAGVSLGQRGKDAVSPDLYPDIIRSVPFCLSLFDVPVVDKEKKRTTVAEYFKNDTRSPWWGIIIGAPRKLKKMLMPSKKEEDEEENHKPDSFKLTWEEAGIVSSLRDAITANVEEKTNVVTINVTTQDPMVTALLADTVMARLKEYVTEYRTNKARQDMAYIEKLNNEAKEAYYAAQQKYANYLDTHQGMVMYSAQTMRDRLENEATLAFNLFNQTSQQLQMAKAKVQEQTPVYATITPATVPLRPSAPRKMLILVGFVMLAFFACVGWILVVEPLKNKYKEEKEVK